MFAYKAFHIYPSEYNLHMLHTKAEHPLVVDGFKSRPHAAFNNQMVATSSLTYTKQLH